MASLDYVMTVKEKRPQNSKWHAFMVTLSQHGIEEGIAGVQWGHPKEGISTHAIMCAHTCDVYKLGPVLPSSLMLPKIRLRLKTYLQIPCPSALTRS